MIGLEGDEGVSGYFLRFNRSKKSICLDLKSDEGRRVFGALLEHADVLVENFRPGRARAHGLRLGRALRR